jgi:hypothetical protein
MDQEKELHRNFSHISYNCDKNLSEVCWQSIMIKSKKDAQTKFWFLALIGTSSILALLYALDVISFDSWN